jgi:glycosyltransferase involved in cell wall biosynthesis
MTDPLGQSQVLPYLAGLSKCGYTFHLISAEKSDRFLKYRSEIEAICKKSGILWYPLYYHNQPIVFGTIFDLFRIYFLSLRIFRSNAIYLVHCRSYIPSFIGVRLKQKYKIPFLFDMRGFWVNEKKDGKVWNLKNPVFRLIFRYMKEKERMFFNEADAVISLTKKAIPEIKKIIRFQQQSTPVHVIPCCVDTEFFDSELVDSDQLEKQRTRLNIQKEDFVLSYLGSISTWYLPEEMLRFFSVLLKIQPNAKFLFITTEDPSLIYQLADNTGVPRDRIVITSAIRSEVRTLLVLSQASLFFIKPAYSKIASSPTKLGELLSLNIPVICNSGIGDTDEIIENSDAGIICHHFDQESYEEAANSLLKSIKYNDGIRLRKIAENIFSLKKGVMSYETVYKSLIRSDDTAHFSK